MKVRRLDHPYSTKNHTLDVTVFSWYFWRWHLYTKSMTLCVIWRFYIQKARHFAKRKTIWIMFLYSKIRQFALHDFYWIFKFFGGGGVFIYWNNQCTLCHILISGKHFTLRYVAIYKYPDTIRYIFISKKPFTFRYVYPLLVL